MSENPFAELIAAAKKKKAEADKPAEPAKNAESRGSFVDPLMQGITFGAADEISGAVGGLIDMAKGKDYLPAYRRTRDKVRGDVEGYAEENPGTAAISEIGGALLTAPISGPLNVVRGAGLGARAVNAAATGAAYGGLYGANTAEGGIAERVEGGAKGAAFGGVAAGAAPVVLRGGKLVLGAAARPFQRAAAAANPEKEASRRIVDALSKDTGGRPDRAVDMLRNARQQGTPLIAADTGAAAGGRRTQALMRSAANTSPEARAALEPVLSERFGNQNIRAATVLTNLVRTPANANVTREALQDAAHTSRKPFYDRAFRDGAAGVLTPEIEQLMQAPAMQKAMRAAATSIKDKTATGRAINPLSPNGTPTLEYWDQVQRNLRSTKDMAARAGNKELAADIDAIRRTLVRQLDDAVPSYATARGVAATLFKAEDALDAGEKFVKSNMKNLDARKALAAMTPEERTLFREGFVSKFIDDVMGSNDRRTILNQINASPAARERMEIALGPSGYQKMEAFLRIENVMELTKNALGNSTTTRQMVEAGLAGGGLGLIMSGGNFTDPKVVMMAMLGAATRRGVGMIDSRVSQRVGEMLASDDPEVIQKAINMVAGNPRLSDFFRKFEDYVVRSLVPMQPEGPMGASIPAAMGEQGAQQGQ